MSFNQCLRQVIADRVDRTTSVNHQLLTCHPTKKLKKGSYCTRHCKPLRSKPARPIDTGAECSPTAILLTKITVIPWTFVGSICPSLSLVVHQVLAWVTTEPSTYRRPHYPTARGKPNGDILANASDQSSVGKRAEICDARCRPAEWGGGDAVRFDQVL